MCFRFEGLTSLVHHSVKLGEVSKKFSGKDSRIPSRRSPGKGND